MKCRSRASGLPMRSLRACAPAEKPASCLSGIVKINVMVVLNGPMGSIEPPPAPGLIEGTSGNKDPIAIQDSGRLGENEARETDQRGISATLAACQNLPRVVLMHVIPIKVPPPLLPRHICWW